MLDPSTIGTPRLQDTSMTTYKLVECDNTTHQLTSTPTIHRHTTPYASNVRQRPSRGTAHPEALPIQRQHRAPDRQPTVAARHRPQRTPRPKDSTSASTPPTRHHHQRTPSPANPAATGPHVHQHTANDHQARATKTTNTARSRHAAHTHNNQPKLINTSTHR